jgi:hypothetical protein
VSGVAPPGRQGPYVKTEEPNVTDEKQELGQASLTADAGGVASLESAAESPGFLRDRRGAIFVEFLIAFLPVQVFFLCLIQSAILYSVRLLTEHAAVNGARAAAVVVGDNRAFYGGEPENTLPERGERLDDVRDAVMLTLAPMILNGLIQSVDVSFPDPAQTDGRPRPMPIRFNAMGPQSVEKVRVHVRVESACRIGFASMIVCPSFAAELTGFLVPTRTVRAEAIFPYQGASYVY